MKVNQISGMLNEIYGEVLGSENLFTEDLTNIVSAGQIITASSAFGDNFDQYAGKIIDKVGRSIFVDRIYRATDLGIWRDSWEYASMLEKVRCEVKDFVDNDEWKLLDGTDAGTESDYNQTDIVDKLFGFVGPDVQAKYFNLKTTFRNKISITRKQLRSAFRGVSEMVRFIAMIENRIQTKLEIGKQELERRVITNLACAAYDAGNVVDLEARFVAEVGKDDNGTSISVGDLTLEKALKNPAVLRFIAEKMTMTRKLMEEPSNLYSITKQFTNFTPEDLSRLVVLSDLDIGLKFHLYGDTYNEEFVKLNGYKMVPYWQGRKDGTSVDTTAARAMVSATAKVSGGAGHETEVVDKTVGIGTLIGVLFDRDAAMICNEDPEVRSQYNADGNFTNFFYNFDCNFYNDFDENATVFVWGTQAVVVLAKGGSSTTTKISSTLLRVPAGGEMYAISGDTVNSVAVGAVLTDVSGWTKITATGSSGTTVTTASGKVITVITVEKKSDGNGGYTYTVTGKASADAVVGS